MLEAQMRADPDFFLRLYAESARFLHQEKTIRRWQVVVLCPQVRVRWLELQPALHDPGAPPLLRTLALLLDNEERLPATTAAIPLARFTPRPIPEISAMGGLTVDDVTQSVAYRESLGLGEERGRARNHPAPVTTPLEALAKALLEFQGVADLEAWLAAG
ncbi:MAG: DUF2887 domain-containing protein [Prochlorococcaceae cyanobacterium]